MAPAVNSCGHLGTEQLHLLLIAAWSLIQLQVMAQGQALKPLQHVYYAAENDTIRIRCVQDCHNSQPFQTLWNIQVPGYKDFNATDLVNDQLELSFEDNFGIQIQTDVDITCSYEANKSIFYLEIAGVNASLNNSVVLCGVINIENMYIHTGMIIIVNRTIPDVQAPSVVNYLTENGVRIHCTHSCNGGWAELQHLWMMTVFEYRDLGPLALHNDTVRARVEEDLGIEIHLTADANSCVANSNMINFYLEIVGSSSDLQHATASCGVKPSQNSPEVYSDRESFIVINETEVSVTRMINYANESGVTIECMYTCNGISNPLLLWAIEMSETEDRLELHDDDIRSQLENDLGITIQLVSEASSCDEQEGIASFYLVISGMDDRLQHSTVSCGVKKNLNTSETYSTCDSYIVIIEKAAVTETKPLPVTTLEETSGDPNTSITSAAVAKIATPLTLGCFVIGALVGAIAIVLFSRVRRAGYKDKVRRTCQSNQANDMDHMDMDHMDMHDVVENKSSIDDKLQERP